MTAWTGTLPTTVFDGGIIFGADITTMLSALHGLADPWTAFTPTWTATTTNPVLGNGTIDAAYMQVGKLVTYAGCITAGSTTTFGSGIWVVSLPVTSVDVLVGAGTALYGAAGGRYAGSCRQRSNTTLDFASPSGTAVGPTTPAAWASTNQFFWSITYPAA